jgi:hypothetical protein
MGRGRRVAAFVALIAAVVCAPARADIPGALTLSGPLSDEQAVALDDHGNASIAWRTADPAQDRQIHFCRLPAGATVCAPDTVAPLQHGGYVPAPILEDPSDGSQVRMVVETAATDQQFNGQTVVFSSGDGGATYGAPVASGGGDLILPSVTVGGPGAFSWSSLAFGSFLSGPLDGSSTTQPINLAPDGPNDNEEPMGIGFPDPTTPLAVWYHVHTDNGTQVKTITYRHWLGTGSVNDPSTWGPVRDFTPPDGIQSSESTTVASGPKGVFAMYAPQKPPGGKCGTRPELVRYDAAADTWSAPRPIDDDPHAGLSDACGYDNGGSGTAFSISQDGQGVLHALYTFHSGKPFADQTTPQGLLYSVSSDGGLTWARPVSIAKTDQITNDGGFRVAVNASGAAVVTWHHSTGSASSGDVIQALRLPPLSATKPGGSTGPCPALITVGKTKLLATQGCWAKTGKRYTATGAVRIDGIDLLPKGGTAASAAAAPSISVDTATRIVTSAGAYQTKIGSVDLGSKRVDWQLPDHAGQLLDAASGDPVQLAISNGQTVLGLPVAGIVTPSFGATGLASIPLNLQLPAPLDGVLGGGLTDDVTFTSDVTRGLHLDRGSIAIDLPEVDLGVARISPFHVDYNADPFVFAADIGLELPGGFGSLEGALTIRNGDLVDLSGHYNPPSPGIAVASGVFLTQIRFGLHNGQTCNAADQTAIDIGANLSGGGDVGGVSLLEIDGSAIFKLGSSSCHLPAVFRIDGDGKIVGLAVAHVYFQYTTPALLEFGAAVALGSHDTVGIEASVDGGINAANGHFFIEGKGNVYVLGYNPASVDVIGSNIGLGACAKLTLLPGSNLVGVDSDIDAGGYILWDDLHLTIMKAGCDVSFLKPKDFTAAHASAVGPQTFTVKPGTPSQTFLAFGKTKAPSFVLKSPTGATYTSPTAEQQQNADGPTEGLTLDGNQEASILVHKPAAGTWTLTPQGDEPVEEVRTAAGVVMPRATAAVRSIGGRRFKLTYKVAGAGPNVAVDVFERGRGAQHAIGSLKGSHGVLRFKPAAGPGGRRDIIAVPHGVGAPPTRSTVIAHYVAPKPAAPPAPRHVRLARGRGAMRVSWSPSAGAKRYVVRATLRDGRRQEIPVKASHRFAVLQHVPGPDSGAVRVYAIGADALVSKPGIAKLKAVHVHRHRATKKKRHARRSA